MTDNLSILICCWKWWITHPTRQCGACSGSPQWSLLPVKLQIFPHACLYTFWKHNFDWFILPRTMLQNKEWWAHALMVNYWKVHKPICFVHSHVLSVTQRYKRRTTWKAPLQSIMENTENSLVKCPPHISKLWECLSDICVSHWSHYALTTNHQLYTVSSTVLYDFILKKLLISMPL